jgi:hypothetical protein
MRWATVRGLGELRATVERATVERAVERGWVILEGTSGRPLERKAVLTDEGRRLARRGEIRERLLDQARIGRGESVTPKFNRASNGLLYKGDA